MGFQRVRHNWSTEHTYKHKKTHVLLLSNHFLALCYPKYLQNVCARNIAENQQILVSFFFFFTLWSLLVKVDRAFSGVIGKTVFSLSGSEVWAFQHLISNFWNFFFKLCISLELETRVKNRNTVHQTPGFYIHDWKASTFILEIIHSFFCSEKYVLVNKLQMKSGHLKLIYYYITLYQFYQFVDTTNTILLLIISISNHNIKLKVFCYLSKRINWKWILISL